MVFFEEVKIFIKHIAHCIFYFAGSAFFFIAFGLNKIVIFKKNFFLPLPMGDSFSVQIFKIMKHDFLPEGVRIIVTNPWSGFMVQVEIAMALAFIVTVPFFLYKMIQYLSPALFEREKKTILKSIIPSTSLFLLGCVFAYRYMIPLTFKFMYPFATSLDVTPFFTLDAFISWVICILIATGVTFLLPIFMFILTFLGIVRPSFWKNRWKPAFLFLLIFSAVITPDQTGITMALLFVPLMLLYAAGAILAGRFERNWADAVV